MASALAQQELKQLQQALKSSQSTIASETDKLKIIEAKINALTPLATDPAPVAAALVTPLSAAAASAAQSTPAPAAAPAPAAPAAAK